MNDLNIVPKTGSFGNSVDVINQNFILLKDALEQAAYSNMGFFQTEALLTSSYPDPEEGWVAYVGATKKIYMTQLVSGSYEWYDTGLTDSSAVNVNYVGYQFMGVATPSTSPGTPDQNVFYIGGAGTYANFGTSVTVPVGSIGVFKYNGSWTKEQIKMFDGIDDVPTYDSENLITSGALYKLQQKISYIGDDDAVILSYNRTTSSGTREEAFVSIKQSTEYIVSNSSISSNSCFVLFYDSNNTRIGSAIGVNVGDSIEITSPSNAVKMGIASYYAVSVEVITKGKLYTISNEINERITNIDKSLNKKTDDIIGYVHIPIEHPLEGYYSNDGTHEFEEYSWARSTSLLPLNRDTTYRVTAISHWNVSAVYYWDSDRNFISCYPSGYQSSETIFTNQKVNDLLPIPSNAAYISFSSLGANLSFNISFTYDVLASDYKSLYELTKETKSGSYFNGKACYFIGDSVMQGNNDEQSVKSITWYMREKYDMECVNLARGGAILTSNTNYYAPIYQMLTSIPSDADYIIMQGGLNGMDKTDISHPWGSISDGFTATLDTISQIGCLEAMCKYVVSNFSNKKYGFIINYKIGAYDYWEEKSALIQQVLDKWGIPYLDWRHSGINLASPDNAAVYGVDAEQIYPAFSTSESYDIDDRVRYDNKTYKANQSVSPGVFNPTQWDLVSTARYDTWHCNAVAYNQLADKTVDWMKSL